MKTLQRFLHAILFCVASAATVASLAATGTGTATAVIVQPLSVQDSKPVTFGAFEAHEGTVRIATSGVRSGQAGVLAGADAAAGEITIRGEPNATYTVSGSGNMLVDGASGAAMAITSVQFADASTPEAEITVGQLADGMQVLKVGATLAVSGELPPGSYSGSYTVTVNYN